MDELGHHDEIAAEDQDGAGVVCGSAVVCCGEERDQVALCKALKTVHDALVRAHDELQVVDPAEVLHAVRPECDEPRATGRWAHTLHQRHTLTAMPMAARPSAKRHPCSGSAVSLSTARIACGENIDWSDTAPAECRCRSARIKRLEHCERGG